MDVGVRACLVETRVKRGWTMQERKVVVITGASQGIGARLVRRFRELGYRVVANSRSISETPPAMIRRSPSEATLPPWRRPYERGGCLADRHTRVGAANCRRGEGTFHSRRRDRRRSWHCGRICAGSGRCAGWDRAMPATSVLTVAVRVATLNRHRARQGGLFRSRDTRRLV